MTAAERLRARYHANKAARRCVDCSAGLQPDDKTTCVECTERRRDARLRYMKRHPERYLKQQREYQRTKYRASPEAGAARMRAYREECKIAGRCPECGESVKPDSSYCAFHHEVHRIRSLNWHRRKAGTELLPVPTRERRTPMFQLVPMRPLRERAAVAAPAVSTRDTILSLIGWLTAKPVRALVAELRDLGVDITQRNIERHLHNLVRAGLAERVVFDGSRDSNDRGYVLTKSARRAA